MPRRKKPPHLFLRKEPALEGETGIRRVWVIKDGAKHKRTGCAEHEVGAAEQALQEYLGQKHDPITRDGRASDIPLANVLSVYLDHKIETTPRPKEFAAGIARLNKFWGGRTAADILGPTCREFALARKSVSGARRDLETLRAAVKHYKAEYGMQAEPIFSLPEKSQARERWMTRDEIASLLWSCHRSKRRKHLVRFILIGVYTATRHQAILRLQWMPNTNGGWVDLDKGVMYRRAAGAKETKKRTPPIRVPDRLLAHMRRWQQADKGIRSIVHYEGREIDRLENSFRRARVACGLDAGVIPHALRHTAITWQMQAGTDPNQVAGFAGVTAREMERTYVHHHPDYQDEIASKRMVGKRRPKASAN